jgi:glycosyltransferase involved in cell wall biosynthesis
MPPPITGHSLVSKYLAMHLDRMDVKIVNLSIGSKHNGSISLARIAQVIKILWQIAKLRKNSEIIYLTISQSLAGNIKDLAIYILLLGKLNRLYIHLHGGSFRENLLDRYPALLRINRFFTKKMAGIIVSGKSHKNIFYGMISPNKISIVKNFSEDYLFQNQISIEEKFRNIEKINVLYISGMNHEKGCYRLLEAFKKLSPTEQNLISLNFAGRFDSKELELDFINQLDKLKNIKYHGIVNNQEKLNLFSQCHLFCLPTILMEAQPISILEAYASGCVVATNNVPGILDIFQDNINGYLFKSKNMDSIVNVLRKSLHGKNKLMQIALHNNKTSQQNYRGKIFVENIISIICKEYT